MQLEISREALLRPLQLVSGALGGRPTLPVPGPGGAGTGRTRCARDRSL